MKTVRPSLAARRARLLEQIAAERLAMASRLRDWQQPLAMVDLGCSVARFVRHHPLAMAGGYGVLRLVLRRPLSRIALWWRRGRLLRSALRII